MDRLSGKEREVLELLCEGATEVEVSRRLGLSGPSVQKLVARIEEIGGHEPESLGKSIQLMRSRRLENRCRSLEGRFRALLDAAPDAILVVDGRSGKIREVNQRAVTMLGFSQESLLAMSVEDLVPPEHRALHPAYRIGFLASVRKREMGYHPPIRSLRGDGTTVELVIGLTASTADDDVMVVCTEYARWLDGQRESEGAVRRQTL